MQAKLNRAPWKNIENQFLRIMKRENFNSRIEEARSFVQKQYSEFPVPEKSYLIFMTPRTGSNLLAKQLKKMELGNPIEAFHFNKKHIQKQYGLDVEFSKPVSHMREAINFQCINGVFGMKISWQQLNLFQEVARKILSPSGIHLLDKDLFEVFFPSVSYIYIRRRDKVKQAVSLSKGMQTGIWMEKIGEDQRYKQYILPPLYDREHIEGCLEELLAYDASWMNYLKKHGFEFLEVWYEDLANNYVNSTNLIYDYLEVEKSITPEPVLSKQADSKSYDWGKKFISETSWLQDATISEALISGDLVTAFIRRCTMIIHKKEQDRWHSMPATRFKPFRKFLFRVKRKLSSIFKS
jgi:LPS sulfotransferase NodH